MLSVINISHQRQDSFFRQLLTQPFSFWIWKNEACWRKNRKTSNRTMYKWFSHFGVLNKSCGSLTLTMQPLSFVAIHLHGWSRHEWWLAANNFLQKNKVQLPWDWIPTWPPFHCFMTPIGWTDVTSCENAPWLNVDIYLEGCKHVTLLSNLHVTVNHVINKVNLWSQVRNPVGQTNNHLYWDSWNKRC